MRTCDEAQAALVDLVFGELDDAVELELHRHLRECAGCRAEEERLLALDRAARRSRSAPSAALRDRIGAALEGVGSGPARSLVTRPVPLYWVMAAAALGALLVGVLPWRPLVQSPPPGESSRPVRIEDGGPLPFTVAASYDTRVRPAGPVNAARDSSPAALPRGDSL